LGLNRGLASRLFLLGILSEGTLGHGWVAPDFERDLNAMKNKTLNPFFPEALT
jgi:hypothetical protein